jgi:hypothetical protein
MYPLCLKAAFPCVEFFFLGPAKFWVSDQARMSNTGYDGQACHASADSRVWVCSSDELMTFKCSKLSEEQEVLEK